MKVYSMPSSKSKPQLPTARSQSKCQSFCGKVLSLLNFKVSASRGGCGSRFHFVDNFWTLWEELHPSFDVSLRNSPTETYPFWTFFLSMKENWWVTHTHTHKMTRIFWLVIVLHISIVAWFGHVTCHDRLSTTVLSGHLGEWVTPWPAEEMLDGQHQ